MNYVAAALTIKYNVSNIKLFMKSLLTVLNLDYRVSRMSPVVSGCTYYARWKKDVLLTGVFSVGWSSELELNKKWSFNVTHYKLMYLYVRPSVYVYKIKVLKLIRCECMFNCICRCHELCRPTFCWGSYSMPAPVVTSFFNCWKLF